MKTKNPIYAFFLWITNNEPKPRHEVEFDITFFILNTLILIAGSYGLYTSGEWPWISIIAIEYCWALDTLRHNR